MPDSPDFERRRHDRGPLDRAWNVVYDAFRFLALHMRGFYAAIITYLSFSFIVGILAVVGFVAFANEVVGGSTQALDEWVVSWAAAQRTPVLDHVALEITALSNTTTVIMLVLIAGIFLWQTKHHYSVYLLATAVIGGQIVNNVLKIYFDRPRPSVVEWGTDVVTQSFPSGHAMAAAVAYGSIAYLVGRLEATRRLRITTWTIAAIAIVLTGLSRIYLGVHYPSDVIAGFVAGLAWVAFVASGIAAIRYFSYRKPDIEEEEQDLDGPDEDEEDDVVTEAYAENRTDSEEALRP